MEEYEKLISVKKPCDKGVKNYCFYGLKNRNNSQIKKLFNDDEILFNFMKKAVETSKYIGAREFNIKVMTKDNEYSIIIEKFSDTKYFKFFLIKDIKIFNMKI